MANKTFECPYAPKGAIWCEKRTCHTCGWNPEVAEARLEAVKQKMAEEEAAKKNGQVKAKA